MSGKYFLEYEPSTNHFQVIEVDGDQVKRLGRADPNPFESIKSVAIGLWKTLRIPLRLESIAVPNKRGRLNASR